MFETITGYFWIAVLVYASAGFLFGALFVFFWSGRLDAAALRGSWGFRLAILPGVIALWPLMLVKTLHAQRHRYVAPDAERLCAARTLRCIHGAAFVAIVLLVPLICGTALLIRPKEERSVVRQLTLAVLPNPVPLALTRPGNLPIEVTVRTDGRRYQAQLEVSRPLQDPVVALYWSPDGNPAVLTRDAVFLGSIWGPSRLFFSLPDETERIPGVLTFIALAGEQRAVGTLPLNRR